MHDKDSQIAILGKELENQKKIFNEQAYRGTNPDGSDAYWKAKAIFDAAGRRIKELDKELVRLITGGTPHDPSKLKDKFPYLPDKRKKRKFGKKGKDKGASLGTSTSSGGQQIQPSQSKVIVDGDE